MSDFTLTNHGSVCLLRPLSRAAKRWLDEHIDDEAQYHGDAVAVSPRYVQPILDGIAADGLEVR